LLERQVRIEGTVEKTSRQESEEYFQTRPRGAQIGAWVSQQSEAIESRQTLEKLGAELEAKFREGAVPCPQCWGCYRVQPALVEFWQGRPSRLHDRLLYVRSGEHWELRRLSP
jgi:pyridoxamine 5'-phosphate oxidase